MYDKNDLYIKEDDELMEMKLKILIKDLNRF